MPETRKVCASSTLSIVDLEQPQEVKRIDLAPHTRPHGVAWFAADRIAVTTEGSRHLLILDPDGGRIVSAIETAQETSHMVVVSADARRAYVTNIGSGTTTAIDLFNRRTLKDIATGAGDDEDSRVGFPAALDTTVRPDRAALPCNRSPDILRSLACIRGGRSPDRAGPTTAGLHGASPNQARTQQRSTPVSPCDGSG